MFSVFSATCRKSARIQGICLNLATALLVGGAGQAKADLHSHPGLACQPESQAYSYWKNIQGVYNNSSTTQVWMCPITKFESDNRVSAFSHLRVIQNHPTQKIACRLIAATFSGGFIEGFVRRATAQGVTTISLNYEFDLIPPGIGVVEAYAIRCEIPPISSGKTSGILSYTVDVN